MSLLPKAQLLRKPLPKYRDYPDAQQRLFLLQRICRRFEKQELQGSQSAVRQRIHDFLLAWFRPTCENTSYRLRTKMDICSLDPNSDESSDSSLEDDGYCIISGKEWTIQSMKKDEVEEFFAWAFFCKEPHFLDVSERLALQTLFNYIKTSYGLVFKPGRNRVLAGRRLTIDTVQPIHHPLLFYAMIYGLEVIGNIFLRIYGFKRYQAEKGLVYWYRCGHEPHRKGPLLFFHGIAPAGKTFYIPFIMTNLFDSRRSLYVIENKCIASTLQSFEMISETETISDVEYLLKFHGDDSRPLALCGHSFGSCPVTWLLHSPMLRHKIQQLILIDPVSILLSDPDVMVNFLYSRLERRTKIVDAHLAGIRFVGSELFTEHFLRRNFAWYNSELWIEDIPDTVNVLICLSENDQILSAPNIRLEVERHQRQNIELVYWKGADHADCIINPKMWMQIKYALRAHAKEKMKKT
jgi:pimeloyl-ACP methyl ester carboxylesterase